MQRCGSPMAQLSGLMPGLAGDFALQRERVSPAPDCSMISVSVPVALAAMWTLAHAHARHARAHIHVHLDTRSQAIRGIDRVSTCLSRIIDKPVDLAHHQPSEP